MRHLVGTLAIALATSASAGRPSEPPDINVTSTDVTFSPNAIRVQVEKNPSDNTLFGTTISIFGKQHSKMRACYDAHNIALMLDAKSPIEKTLMRAIFVENARMDIIDLVSGSSLEVNIDISKGSVYSDNLETRVIDAAAEEYADQIASSMNFARVLCLDMTK